MHEVEALSDRVAILRHGQFIGDMPTKMTNAQEMTNMMVGHAVTLNIERPDPVDPKPRIEVKGLTVRNIEGILKLDDVSFTANSGEILGIAGISGCGQKELLEPLVQRRQAADRPVVQIQAPAAGDRAVDRADPRESDGFVLHLDHEQVRACRRHAFSSGALRGVHIAREALRPAR